MKVSIKVSGIDKLKEEKEADRRQTNLEIKAEVDAVNQPVEWQEAEEEKTDDTPDWPEPVQEGSEQPALVTQE
jgi:hypothetical protein